jgi:oxalate decarboxylase
LRRGSGHYIENTGDDVCYVLSTFNSGDYQEIGLTEWLAFSPIRLVTPNFEIPEALCAVASHGEPLPGTAIG